MLPTLSATTDDLFQIRFPGNRLPGYAREGKAAPLTHLHCCCLYIHVCSSVYVCMCIYRKHIFDHNPNHDQFQKCFSRAILFANIIARMVGVMAKNFLLSIMKLQPWTGHGCNFNMFRKIFFDHSPNHTCTDICEKNRSANTFLKLVWAMIEYLLPM